MLKPFPAAKRQAANTDCTRSVKQLHHIRNAEMGLLGNTRRRHRRINYAHTPEWHRGHVPYKCCKDTHVVITGGASGIGLELAKEAVARSAGAVSIIDVSDCTRAHRELRDCAADGLSNVFLTKIFSIQADVSSYEQVVHTLAGAELLPDI